MRVRRNLGLNYFENRKLIEKQQKAYNKAHKEEEARAAFLAKQKKN
jgi:hypothetical protein